MVEQKKGDLKSLKGTEFARVANTFSSEKNLRRIHSYTRHSPIRVCGRDVAKRGELCHIPFPSLALPRENQLAPSKNRREEEWECVGICVCV